MHKQSPNTKSDKVIMFIIGHYYDISPLINHTLQKKGKKNIHIEHYSKVSDCQNQVNLVFLLPLESES